MLQVIGRIIGNGVVKPIEEGRGCLLYLEYFTSFQLSMPSRCIVTHRAKQLPLSLSCHSARVWPISGDVPLLRNFLCNP
jgi:hypothetical protein